MHAPRVWLISISGNDKRDSVIMRVNVMDEKTKDDISWELEVYRNTHNLCVYCGKPMTTTIFHDVPVCDEHKNTRDQIIWTQNIEYSR